MDVSSTPKRRTENPASVYTPATIGDLVAITPTVRNESIVVIGRGTLPFLLAFLNRGCRSAAELRISTAAPDVQPADLVWITGLVEPKDCDTAVRMALRRAGKRGRIAIDATVLAARKGLARLLRYMKRLGLQVDSTHCIGARIVLLAHG